MSTMKRFINYCRKKCAPRLSAKAMGLLSSYFVEIRKAQKIKADDEKVFMETVPQSPIHGSRDS